MLRFALPFTLLPILASCVGPQSAPPASAPAAVAAPVRTTPPPPAAIADRYTGDWSVADVAPGEWRYTTSSHATAARFGSGADGVMIMCERRQLILARGGQARDGARFNVRTSFAERRLPTVGGTAGSQPVLTASLASSDPLWDQIVYSRGRILLETSGLRPMIVPVGSEISRVIEDCRG